MLRGEYWLWPGDLDPSEDKSVVLPNNLIDEGEESFLKMIVRADVSDVAAGGNFYVGLMGSTFAETTTLATLAGEPSSAGTYARQAVARNSSGWPTVEQVSGKFRAVSAQLTFTAVGANFDTAFSRTFLCNVASGSSGLLFSVSSPLTSALTVAIGSPLVMQYILYID